MAMKVPLSFKESEKDMYDHLMKQLSASIYVKGLIRADMKKTEESSTIPHQKKCDLLDF